MTRKGRPPVIEPTQYEALRKVVQEHPHATLAELAIAIQPSEAVIDSQSTRGSAQGGMLGFDAGKKVKGRKRHPVVDTVGLLLAVVITSAASPIAPQLLRR